MFSPSFSNTRAVTGISAVISASGLGLLPSAPHRPWTHLRQIRTFTTCWVFKPTQFYHSPDGTAVVWCHFAYRTHKLLRLSTAAFLMTCFSPLSVLELHFPKPCPANSVHLYKSRQIFLTPHSPSPNLLCSGRLGIFWGVLPSPSAKRTKMPHRPPSCGDSALFPLLSHLGRPNCSSGVLVTLILWQGWNCSLSWAQRISQLQGKPQLQQFHQAHSGWEPQPLNPSCALSKGTPLSSTSLPNFTGNPFLLLGFFLLILFFFLQKNSIGKLKINRTPIKTSVAVFLPPSCTQFLL